ncbi:hypothetical protein [Micromonospora mirobrigensis]|uniref:Immunity protein 50 n=1 Tax=Micromonospora mirobrigensis TaxID=262898 RepID=A0A1C5ANF5_9ACTN|nr:hypothetical protein [Micromonospora mirobrigensis]SCF46772.1 hypothetical protein GA0070564_11458 [Micromonospora mirobrigensis]
MISLPHEPSGLTKATWTDADFPEMGWHDCRIHAVSVGEYEDDTLPPGRLLLDLDYIVRWVPPADGESPFDFWIAPATLVFEQACQIDGRLGPLDDLLEIADIHRLDPTGGGPERWWHIEGQNFDLRLRAAGYTQYLRLPPRQVGRQVLTAGERGGPSLAERSFA